MLRKLVWSLPAQLQPKPKPVVWAVAFDPDSGAAVAGLHMTHPEFSMVTGLVEAGDRLWLGSIAAPHLGWVDLPRRVGQRPSSLRPG